MANPANIFALDDIKFITGCEVETVRGAGGRSQEGHRPVYDAAGSMANVMKEFDEDLEVVEDLEDEAGTAAI